MNVCFWLSYRNEGSNQVAVCQQQQRQQIYLNFLRTMNIIFYNVILTFTIPSFSDKYYVVRLDLHVFLYFVLYC